MKKIFTLALSALAAVGLSAAPVQHEMQTMTLSKSKLNLAASNTCKTIEGYQNTNVSRADFTPDGSYIILNTSSTPYEAVGAPVIKQKSGSTYSVDNFFGAGSITVEGEWGEFTFNEGTDEEFQNLAIVFKGAGETEVLENSQGIKLGMYLCDPAAQKVYSNDIEFLYDEEEDVLFWPWQGMTLMLGYVDGQSIRGFQITPTVFYRANGTMTSDEYINNDDIEKTSYNLFFFEQDGQILTFNNGGFGYPMLFEVDGEEAIAEECVLTETSNGQVIATQVENDALTYAVVAAYEETDDAFILSCPEWYAMGDGGWYGHYTNCTWTLSKTGELGIGNVAVDNTANANAPVVYYNLQGQRINTPAAGQIVIRKQGTEATKLLVK